MFVRILVGLIGIPAGILILKYTMFIKENFIGDIDWAEKHLGRGGTYTLIKIIGVIISILCFLYMVGSLQTMMYDFFAPISGQPVYNQSTE